MRAFGVFAVAATVGFATLRCSTFSEEPPTPVGSEGGQADAISPVDGGGELDGPASDACAADTANDPKNCGACGHDCLGGKCRAGACQPLALAAGLTSAGEVALAADRVFFDVAGAGGTRDIVACSLPSCAGGPQVVVSGVPAVKSLLAHDGLLLFYTHDQASTANVIEECNPKDAATCSATRRPIEPTVNNIFDAFTPMRRGVGAVYWAFSSGGTAELRKLAVAAGSTPTSAAALGCTTARVAPGLTELAWACLGGELRTCALPCTQDGGTVVPDASATGGLERGTRLVFEDDATGNLTVVTTPLRQLPGRGHGPFTVVGDTLLYQDGVRNEIVACDLPACVSRLVLAEATAARIDADTTRLVWTSPSNGSVMTLAR